MTSYVGIDFGTTNSAIAVAGQTGAASLRPFPLRDGATTPTWRTVLYFQPHDDDAEDGVTAGSPAIERYIDNDGEGRFVQSIKSYLASALFSRTQILGRIWSLEKLVAAYLTRIRLAAGVERGTRAVVGRPVRYWGAETDDDDARAVGRMRKALELAGFDDVVFEYEPVAAAARYATRIDRDEVVLIADFGGGTSDFSLVTVGPGVDAGDTSAILATGGIGIGGDTFDGRIVDAVIAPLLGKGTGYRDEFGSEMPIPPWIYGKLRRWHHLSFLKTPKTMHLLDRIHNGAIEPGRVANLMYVVKNDLGLAMHQAIEKAKVALSADERSQLRLVDPPLALSAAIEREGFEDWIEPDLGSIDTVIDDVLERAGATEDDVDRVFTTGGSSFVPAIRARLGSRFGFGKILGGDELTSVASGLAIRARQVFS
jgi:hypothetical chaperone protein